MPSSRLEILIGRALRFLVSGSLTTGVVYVAWMMLLKVMNYAVATVLAWAVGVLIGFMLNRRFTFGIVGADHRTRHFALFLTGALGQLLIAEVATYVTLGQLKLAPTIVFAINLVLNTTFSFVFMNVVTFRTRSVDAKAAG